uniref:Uncharacterized protein n=1 Tax=Cacopsylla melanoneura TaxID=428564 RepID=A0A8D8LYB6_9HEMI
MDNILALKTNLTAWIRLCPSRSIIPGIPRSPRISLDVHFRGNVYESGAKWEMCNYANIHFQNIRVSGTIVPYIFPSRFRDECLGNVRETQTSSVVVITGYHGN